MDSFLRDGPVIDPQNLGIRSIHPPSMVDIVPSSMESNTDHYSFTGENNDYLRVTALYRGDNWGGICPQRGESASRRGCTETLQRTIVIFPFPPEEVVHDFHLPSFSSLPFSFFFLERSHEEFQVRGEVGRMRLESGRPAYGLINHGMIGERRISVE